MPLGLVFLFHVNFYSSFYSLFFCLSLVFFLIFFLFGSFFVLVCIQVKWLSALCALLYVVPIYDINAIYYCKMYASKTIKLGFFLEGKQQTPNLTIFYITDVKDCMQVPVPPLILL